MLSALSGSLTLLFKIQQRDRRNNLTFIRVFGNFVFVVTENLWLLSCFTVEKLRLTDLNITPASSRRDVLMDYKRLTPRLVKVISYMP